MTDPEIVLLDTCIVSVLLKTSKVHDARRKAIADYLKGKIGTISFVTVAELLFWAERKSWGQSKRAELDQRLKSLAILDPSRVTAQTWAESKRAFEKVGKNLQPHDQWIAAAAIEHGLTIVTDDTDFDGLPNLSTKSI